MWQFLKGLVDIYYHKKTHSYNVFRDFEKKSLDEDFYVTIDKLQDEYNKATIDPINIVALTWRHGYRDQIIDQKFIQNINNEFVKKLLEHRDRIGKNVIKLIQDTTLPKTENYYNKIRPYGLPYEKDLLELIESLKAIIKP